MLDAPTGTGFAAIAPAQIVGPEGHVYGIDISGGMLREARAAATASGLTNLEFIEDDASVLPRFPSGIFDVITCAAGLLYMPVSDALRAWHRLLKRGGIVAFSTMQAGSPPAGRMGPAHNDWSTGEERPDRSDDRKHGGSEEPRIDVPRRHEVRKAEMLSRLFSRYTSLVTRGSCIRAEEVPAMPVFIP